MIASLLPGMAAYYRISVWVLALLIGVALCRTAIQAAVWGHRAGSDESDVYLPVLAAIATVSAAGSSIVTGRGLYWLLELVMAGVGTLIVLTSWIAAYDLIPAEQPSGQYAPMDDAI